MKKILCMTLAVLMLFSLCACGGSAGDEEKQADSTLQVGFGKVNITPSYSVGLGGSGNDKIRRSTGMVSYVFATCVAFLSGGETYLVYTVDTLSINDNLADQLRVRIVEEIPEVKLENIYLMATHGHSCPTPYWPDENEGKYRNDFFEWIPQAGKQAIADLAPATMEVAQFQVEGMNFVRHYIMNDGTYAGSNFGSAKSGYKCHAHDADSELQIAKLARTGKKDIVLLSFPSHGTFNEHDTLISADFPAGARDTIEQSGEYLVAYFMGASGDQVPSSRIPGEAIADYREHGNRLGNYALQALQTLTKLDKTGMQLTTVTFTAPTNKADMEKLEEAKIIRQLINDCGPTSAEVKEAVKKYGFSSRIHANWVVTRSQLEDTKSMDLRVLNVGDLAFVLAPYEMFGQHGMEIKEKSPFATTFIITCSEGSFNYIPTVEAFDYGCYEGYCSYWEKGTGDKLVTEYLDILGQHKGA